MTNNARARVGTDAGLKTEPMFSVSVDVASPSGTLTKKQQRNYPNLPLEQAIVVARAIQDGASGMDVSRITLAELMERSPDSSKFRDRLQASRAYGLTNGGVHANEFGLTALGNAATGADEDEQLRALRQAVLSIEPYKAFLNAFNNKKIPNAKVCTDFLTNKAGVPADRAAECAQFLFADARFVGFVRKVSNGGEYIELQGSTLPLPTASPQPVKDDYAYDDDDDEGVAVMEPPIPVDQPRLSVVPKLGQSNDDLPPQPAKPKKVFIAHGRDRGPLEQVKKMLDKIKVPYAVAVDEPHRGRPVSAKVASLMREECSSAIFIFTADEHFVQEDEQGNKVDVWRPSENAVYELGAASVLYDRRIVILKDERIKLASDFSDLGYFTFHEGQIGLLMPDLLQELVALDILGVVTKG